MAGSGHLAIDALAALADGRLPEPDAERARQHLATCAQCLDAFATAAGVHLRGPAALDAVDPSLIALGKAVASAPAAGPRLPGAGARLRRTAGVWRPRVLWPAVTSAALAGLALVLFWPAGRSAPDMTQLAGVELAPLHGALRDMSVYVEGALVLPGGEAFADAKPGPAQRSADGAASPQVHQTLAGLEDLEAKGGLTSPRLAYWLGVGYLAVGDLTTARIHLDQALRRFPDQVDLLLLDAVYANRNNELTVAEQRLRSVLAVQPRHRLARVDLGILLARDPQRRAEARTLLEAAARGADGPLAERARRVLGELPAD